MKFNRMNLVWIGAGALCLALLLYFLTRGVPGGGEKQAQVKQDKETLVEAKEPPSVANSGGDCGVLFREPLQESELGQQLRISSFSLISNRANPGYLRITHENRKYLAFTGRYQTPKKKQRIFVALASCAKGQPKLDFHKEFPVEDIATFKQALREKGRIIHVVFVEGTEYFGWIAHDKRTKRFVFEAFYEQ